MPILFRKTYSPPSHPPSHGGTCPAATTHDLLPQSHAPPRPCFVAAPLAHALTQSRASRLQGHLPSMCRCTCRGNAVGDAHEDGIWDPLGVSVQSRRVRRRSDLLGSPWRCSRPPVMASRAAGRGGRPLLGGGDRRGGRRVSRPRRSWRRCCSFWRSARSRCPSPVLPQICVRLVRFVACLAFLHIHDSTI
jgi:hypothetical protein